MERSSAIPEKSDESESQRTSKDSNVHQRRTLWVAEVGKGQVEEVDDGEEQGPPEVSSAPEMDITKGQEVVEGEVGG